MYAPMWAGRRHAKKRHVCATHGPGGLARKEEAALAVAEIQDYLRFLPKLKESREGLVWMSYDAEADTLYVNYKKPSHATDSELTDDDVIVRYEGEEVVGCTILHASQRDLKS
jgi:uncharacterized protein YuzE